jgi:hypothetical protein
MTALQFSFILVFLLGLFAGAYIASRNFRERVNNGMGRFVRGLEKLGSENEAKSRAKSGKGKKAK